MNAAGVRTRVGAVVVASAQEVLAHRLSHPAARAAARFGAAAAVVAIARIGGISWAELGLGRNQLVSGVRTGAAAGACAAAAVVAGALFPATRAFFLDERAALAAGRNDLAAELARITFTAVPPEELTYRSALLGLRLGDGTRDSAVACSSVLFGLSHILPTLSTMSQTALHPRLARRPLRQAAFVGGNVAVTSVAGAAFAGLRLRSGSVVAPLIAHAALNDAALVAGRFAHRFAASRDTAGRKTLLGPASWGADMKLKGAAHRAGSLLAGGDTVERTAALALAATVGTSFGPGLVPRPGLDQALATGIVGATQHGLVMTSQSACAALARRFVRADGTPSGRARGFAAQAAVSSIVAVAGAVAERMVAARPGEPIRRAAFRTAGRRASRVGLAGAALSAVAAADAAVGERRPGLRMLAAGGGLLVGTALAGGQIHRYHAGEEAGEEAARLAPATDPVTGEAASGKTAPGRAPLPPVAKSLLIGAAVNAGLHGMALAEGGFARGLAAGIRRIAPGAGPVAGLAGHTAGLGVTVAGLGFAVEFINRRAETGGSAIDAAYTKPPDTATVSGGPASAVPWSSLSREGVRFVNLALTRQEIAEVTGAPIEQVKSPVRAFAGLASGQTVGVRVDLVMEDLARLGAFERSVLCVASPTGSGYVNYVAAETLEYLTRGDCATVALQYSLRPSFLSLDRVAMGREQNRVLLHALEWRLRGLPDGHRPRLVVFGESLGAHTMQDAFLHEGVSGLHRVGIDRALFLGTPAESGWAKQWRLDPKHTDPGGEVAEVASYTEWLALPADDRAHRRYVLLSHHEDPITRFEPALVVQQPGWLGPASTRPPGVSHLTSWYPVTTFVLTLVDVKNAMNVTPGTFFARGHDYRADLARMVSEAYGLPVGDQELLAIEHALRRREATWAERRLVAEQLRRAKEAVQHQTKRWGLARASSSRAAAPVRPAS